MGEEVLTWEERDANCFGLRAKGIEGSLKGSYQGAACGITIEVAGRGVPLQVTLEHRTGRYFLLGAGGEASGPDDLAQTLVGEFLTKY